MKCGLFLTSPTPFEMRIVRTNTHGWMLNEFAPPPLTGAGDRAGGRQLPGPPGPRGTWPSLSEIAPSQSMCEITWNGARLSASGRRSSDIHLLVLLFVGEAGAFFFFQRSAWFRCRVSITAAVQYPAPGIPFEFPTLCFELKASTGDNRNPLSCHSSLTPTLPPPISYFAHTLSPPPSLPAPLGRGARDPITDFVRALLVDYDFEAAQATLAGCEVCGPIPPLSSGPGMAMMDGHRWMDSHEVHCALHLYL